ncbi:cytochrome P450 [Schizopora paradoxa]|uniref:Cytochrome P450 n=1 Tax=Schizopora paradoxa TaxID=27342 RepID=A0A0H2REJ9_9AGAM|nr:cytochrome P450 [Schizopora paradoxa]
MLEHFLPLLDVTFLCAASLLLLSIWSEWRQRSKLPLPPGPKRLPIVGNIFQIAVFGSKLWQTALEWRKAYGDMIYLEVVGVPVLIINSHEIAMDLLSKRSSLYSSRPQFVMPTLAGWEWTTAALPYGEKLRKQRAILQKFFLSPDVLNYKDFHQQNCHAFLQGLLSSPERYDRHIHHLAASTLMMNTYGHEGMAQTQCLLLQSEDDPYLQLGEKSARALIDHFSYLFLDFVPWMQLLPEWFPGTGFWKVARMGRELSDKLRYELLTLTKKKMEDGTAKESMTTIFLGDIASNNSANYGTEEGEFANAAAMVFLGKIQTTTAIMNLIHAVLKHPETLRRAQEELDRVIGIDRLPTCEDRDNLPYVNAMCIEVLRWEALGPLGVPHRTTQEDQYRGYRIPEGTLVLSNIWGIANNPDIYPDPLEFKPERWLPGGVNFNSTRPIDFAFGYGRRICPGRIWADNLMFIAAASLLATFNIERVVDASGKPIPLSKHDESSILRSLGPSKCKIEPRSEKAARLICEAVDSL